MYAVGPRCSGTTSMSHIPLTWTFVRRSIPRWTVDTNGGFLNITYNLVGMFEALPCKSPRKWDGCKAEDVAKIVGQSLRMLNDHPGNYRCYEAPNGWGTIDGAKTFLAECLVAFMTYPDAIVEDRD